MRNEDVEGKVFLLENLSAVCEETGELRSLTATGIALQRLPWAQREGWAMRALQLIEPESLVQDSLAQCVQGSTLSTGLWRGRPQRVLGPAIEMEIQGFIDTLRPGRWM